MAFHSNSSNGKDTMLGEINITPMVDVMLVLLIIFMVSAPLMKEGVKVDLPAASAQGMKTEKEEIVLTLSRSGEITLDGDSGRYSLSQIDSKLRTLYQNREKKEILLRADKSVPYGIVVQLMAACKNAGIEKIGMITQPPESPQ